jgi:hypothetical protein
MASAESDLLQGTLDVLILKALALQELRRHGHLAQNRANDQCRFRCEGRLSVSSSSSHGGGWLAHFQLGTGGNKSARKVLFADEERKKAASDRNGTVGADFPSHGAALEIGQEAL